MAELKGNESELQEDNARPLGSQGQKCVKKIFAPPFLSNSEPLPTICTSVGDHFNRVKDRTDLVYHFKSSCLYSQERSEGFVQHKSVSVQ